MTPAGISLLKHFEGCVLHAYPDLGGVLTVGYGHTGPEVKLNMTITQQQADSFLLLDADEAEDYVKQYVGDNPTTANQLAAMTCLTFNIGPSRFRRSTVLRLHNAGDYHGAATAFALWNRAANRVVPGLIRRRAAEAVLYLTP